MMIFKTIRGINDTELTSESDTVYEFSMNSFKIAEEHTLVGKVDCNSETLKNSVFPIDPRGSAAS